MSLGAAGLRSAVWVALRLFSRQLAMSVLFFWLALRLSAYEVGVATLSATLPMLVLPLVTRGIRDAIIQRDALDDVLCDTAFAVNCALGLALGGLLAALAPFLAGLFGDARIYGPALLAGLIPVFAAMANPHEAQLERAFLHKRITLVHAAATVPALAVAVWLVLSDLAHWALVAFNVALYGGVMTLLWGVSPWRPGRQVRLAEARRQLRFAAPIMTSQALAKGNQRIVELIAGALLSPAAAAFLRFGGNFTRVINQAFVAPVIQVLLPMFARSQAAPADSLFRVLVVNATVLFFVFMLTAALLPGFVAAVFGAEWETGAQVAVVLCFGIYATLIGPVALPLLIARDRADWTLFLSVTGVVILSLFVWIGAGQEMIDGTLGAALGFVLRGVLTVPLVIWVLWRVLEIPPRRVIAAFLPFALVGTGLYLVMALAVVPVTAALPYGIGLALQIPAGLGLYLAALHFGVRRLAPEAYTVLRQALPGRFGGWL